MQQLEKLTDQFETFDTPIYTDGSDIDFLNYQSIEKQTIPGSGFFDGKFFLHGRTQDGKYIKGTLWEKSLIDKMESDMSWFRDQGANIPDFERIPVKTSSGDRELIVSEYIEGLETFEVFKKYHIENIGTAIKGIIKFANIHMDYLEQSIEQGIPVLSDVHLRQLHLDSAGSVYMLDLEPRYTKGSLAILLNETRRYKSVAEEFQDLPGIDNVEIKAFLLRCERILEDHTTVSV